MKSTQTNRFSSVPNAEIPRASFNRSHGKKTSFNAGDLIPIFVDEALPGDTFNLNLSAFARLATPLKPIMDNMHMETFFFAVPNRLIWDNWQRFNGEQDNPADSTDFLVPRMEPTSFPSLGLADHFGIPPNKIVTVNALHFRAHNLIYNQWFRDQNLQDSKPINKDDGPDPSNNYGIYKRGKRHDYFTSCLPFPQKGTAVELPLGGEIPITGSAPAVNNGTFVSLGTATAGVQNLTFGDNLGSGYSSNVTNAPAEQVFFGNSGLIADADDALSTMVGDLNAATAVTINSMREAFQLQRLFERDARGGTRYTELIKSHFGVTSPDSRLQRPEYLGGGYSPVNITPVTNTTNVDSNSAPQGNLAGFGTVSASGHSFTKSFTEHCVIIGYVCIRADLTYQQGVNRMWSRQTRFDFFWPALARLGEQEVLNKEIFHNNDANDDLVFGYQERYAEYRYKPSELSALFRSEHPQTLDVWHLAQDFANLPTLSAQFIEENPPLDRVIAVPTEPHFIFDAYFNLKCARPMPMYSVPGMVDHF